MKERRQVTSVMYGHRAMFSCIFPKIQVYSFFSSPACSEYRTESSGVLTSPLYPAYHPTNMNCTWRIEVPAGHVVRLQFLAFELEEQPACAGNFLEITDTHNHLDGLLGKFCGHMFPSVIESLENQMTIKFHASASRSTRSGFKLRYTARGGWRDKKLLDDIE